MSERVADKLLFIMPVAPIFFGDCALAKSLVENELAESTEVAQIVNRVG